jgi:putative heme transporter
VGSTPSPQVRAVRAGLSGALALALLVVVLPRVTGARWSQIAEVLGRLTALEVAALAAVWLAGLWCYSFMLTATLPGLTRPQAVTVNVTGSAVSNLLPFGGAVGLATTFAMLRTWGYPPSTVALSALVTAVWNVLSKLFLPLVGLVGLLVARDGATGRFTAGAAVGAVVLAIALALLAGTLWSERVAAAVGRSAQAVGHGVLVLTRSSRRLHWDDAVPRWRHRVIDVVRAGWWRMTLGLIGFLGSQALLLWLSLRVLGSGLGAAQVFAGFAFGRLLTTVPITPGGVGVTETGVAGLLVAFGGDPDVSASAVLLFSGFAFFAEFPAGALGYLVWQWRRSWRRELPMTDGPAGARPQ